MDDFSKSMFGAMGCEVTESVEATFTEFKALKDRLQPGRLSPEGFAFVAMLANLTNGKTAEKCAPKTKEKKEGDTDKCRSSQSGGTYGPPQD